MVYSSQREEEILSGKGIETMTIASCEKEIRDLIDRHSVVGLEAVLNAIVRSTDGKAWMTKEDVFRYLESCYKMEEYFKKQEERS